MGGMSDFKWVADGSGYKYVDASDPRPAVKLKDRLTEKSLKEASLFIKYDPPWRKYEHKLHYGTAAEQKEAAEKFTEVRDREMATNPQARSWEKGRREWFQREKHAWREERMK